MQQQVTRNRGSRYVKSKPTSIVGKNGSQLLSETFMIQAATEPVKTVVSSLRAGAWLASLQRHV